MELWKRTRVILEALIANGIRNIANHSQVERGTDKAPVFGIRERKGNVQLDLLADLSEATIEQIITRKVRTGSTIMTDEFTSYKGLIYKGYIHRFIEYRKEQYGRGNVHVNGMENLELGKRADD